MDNQNKNGNATAMISIIFLVWFLGSIIALIAASQMKNAGWLLAVTFGQIFAVIGIIALVSIIKEHKRGIWLPALSFIVGAAAMGFGFIIRFGSEDMKDKLAENMPLIGGAAFLLFGGVLLTAEISDRRYIKSRCTYEIPAQCIGFRKRRNHNGKSKMLYSPIYVAIVDGEERQFTNDTFTNFGLPQEGEQRNIFIDPDDGDFAGYFEPRSAKIIMIFSTIISSIMIAVGAAIFIAFLANGRI